MKAKLKTAYMQTANAFAQCTSAVRSQVGAVVVTKNDTLVVGYNGTPSGWDNDCEDKVFQVGGQDSYDEELAKEFPFGNAGERYKLVTKPQVLHAESNAIAKLAKSNESGKGATLFCTLLPCLECSKLIHQAGITEVYYQNVYRSTEGLSFLEKAGITVEQFPPFKIPLI